jgi:hypothetical protein
MRITNTSASPTPAQPTTSNAHAAQPATPKANISTSTTSQWEILYPKELADRWKLPETWIRERTRSRESDPIPHIGFGRYVRFEFGSPELNEWLDRHRRGAGAGSRPRKKPEAAKPSAKSDKDVA